jgi:3',5'-cyclic AMP phosphodiesterase CpdA
MTQTDPTNLPFRDFQTPDFGEGRAPPNIKEVTSVIKYAANFLAGVLAFLFAILTFVAVTRMVLPKTIALEYLNAIQRDGWAAVFGPLGIWWRLLAEIALAIWLVRNQFRAPDVQANDPGPYVHSRVTRMIASARSKLLDRLVAFGFERYEGSVVEALVRVVIAVALLYGAVRISRYAGLLDWARLFLDRFGGFGGAWINQLRIGTFLLIVHGGALFLGIQALFQLKTALDVFIDAWRPSPLREGLWPTDSSVQGPVLTLAHWSDLHITPSDGIGRTDGGKSGNPALRSVVDRFAARIAQTDMLLITGDITDSGDREEWRQFFDIVDSIQCPAMVILPGNHDVNIVSRTERLAFETRESPLRKLRLIRTMAAIDRVQGHNAFVLLRNNKLLSVREYLRLYSLRLNAFAANPDNSPDGFDPLRVWEGLFPMAIDLPQCGMTLILLDSNDTSSSIVTNAFGRLPPVTLARLAKLLRIFHGRAPIIALHHHIALPPSVRAKGFQNRLFERAMTLQDARTFARFMKDHGCSIAFHGHRHIRYLGSTDSIQVISARSTTLGDESPKADKLTCTLPGFSFHSLRRKTDTGIGVTSNELLLI